MKKMNSMDFEDALSEINMGQEHEIYEQIVMLKAKFEILFHEYELRRHLAGLLDA